jgi:DNA-directed RNA polymerase II subunit RPB2
MDFSKDTWDIIDNYFHSNKNYLTKHHLDSYNDFIINKIPKIIGQYNPQIHYKELNTDTDLYKYECHIYYGGKEGKQVYIGRPILFNGNEEKKQMYPNEARLKGLTYAAHIYCDIEVIYKVRNEEDNSFTETSKTFEKLIIGKIPIMLQSKLCILNDATFELRRQMGECPYDQGGYFIVDGAEKVIVSHERKAENKLYIVETPDSKITYSAQIKSIPEDSFKFARTTVVNINNNIEEPDRAGPITIRMPMLNKQVPLCVIFRLLGVESDLDIMKYIFGDLNTAKSKMLMEDLEESVLDTGPIFNQETAIRYLASITNGNTISHILDIIKTDLFPHVGEDFIEKAYYLGYVVNKLLCVKHGLDKPTDRDSFIYKRVDLSGFLLANLFRESFKQLLYECETNIGREYRFNREDYQDDKFNTIINDDNIKKILNPMIIEGMFMKSFKIGTILNKVGLIQALNRLSSVGTVSHLRRINTPDVNVMIGQRKLHGTQYGFICAAETPDGGNIGIKKHLTMTAHVTFGCSGKPIINLVKEHGTLGLNSVSPEDTFNTTKVFVNGKWIGIHHDPDYLVKILKLLRRNGMINVFTSISWDIQMMEITILTDSGRLCRPVYIMKNNQLLLTETHLTDVRNNKINWFNLVSGFKEKSFLFDYYSCAYKCPIDEKYDTSNLIEDLETHSSVIEFIDTDESNNSLLVNSPESVDEDYTYDYCELHPCLLLGAAGFSIPFCNMSQAPRNVYGTGQTKQSVGLYASNYRNRMDGTANILYYPQKPLLSTRLSKFTMANELPTGINAIVAIASYSGYNQEDSVIFNKSSLERGLFRSCYFKTYSATEKTNNREGTEDVFHNPNDSDVPVNLMKDFSYNKVDTNGFVKTGEYVRDNEVLIGKYTKVNDEGYTTYLDTSEVVKQDGFGVVDRVFSDFINTDNQRVCKVRVVTTREPALGDKFASRHGQKGVCGMVLREEDMPFTKDGIVPDMIINPHAFPSRMTLGQFLESVIGKTGSLMGFYSDGTPFTNIDIEPVADILEKVCKYERYGNEVLYNGIFGTQIKCDIFMGPTYYQRLKHMVKDKVNSRARGKMTLKNKQPPSGRSAGGGLRIGEMERDAILAHGAMQFLKESTMERSDKSEMYISENSGQLAIANPGKNRFICQNTDGPLEFNNDTDLNALNSRTTDIHKVEVPYNVKMMIQECEAMNISLRLITNGTPEEKPIDIKRPERFIPQDIEKRNVPDTYSLTLDTKTMIPFRMGEEVIVNNSKHAFNNALCIIEKSLEKNDYLLYVRSSDNDNQNGQTIKMNAKYLTTLKDFYKSKEPAVVENPSKNIGDITKREYTIDELHGLRNDMDHMSHTELKQMELDRNYYTKVSGSTQDKMIIIDETQLGDLVSLGDFTKAKSHELFSGEVFSFFLNTVSNDYAMSKPQFGYYFDPTKSPEPEFSFEPRSPSPEPVSNVPSRSVTPDYGVGAPAYEPKVSVVEQSRSPSPDYAPPSKFE